MIAIGTGDVATILRASALEVWDAFGGDWISAAAVADVIAARHLASPDDVASDLEPFIDRLLEEGLLESQTVGVATEGRATDH